MTTTTTPAPAYPPLSSYVVMISIVRRRAIRRTDCWNFMKTIFYKSPARHLSCPCLSSATPLSLLFEARAGLNVRWGFKRAFGCWAPRNGGALIYCGTAQSNFISPKLDATPTTGWCNEKSFSHSSRPRNRIMVAAAAVRRDEDDRPEVGNLWQQFV